MFWCPTVKTLSDLWSCFCANYPNEFHFVAVPQTSHGSWDIKSKPTFFFLCCPQENATKKNIKDIKRDERKVFLHVICVNMNVCAALKNDVHGKLIWASGGPQTPTLTQYGSQVVEFFVTQVQFVMTSKNWGSSSAGDQQHFVKELYHSVEQYASMHIQ